MYIAQDYLLGNTVLHAGLKHTLDKKSSQRRRSISRKQNQARRFIICVFVEQFKHTA
jgi:malate synthase